METSGLEGSGLARISSLLVDNVDEMFFVLILLHISHLGASTALLSWSER